MKEKKDKEEKSKIETDDTFNRTLYGTPTIGGFIVIGIILCIIFFNLIFK
ncbi:hypothetical protein [Bacillus sp. V3-13]|nr:hypothetical protein [Bacillus sp. V3-13]